MDRRKSKRVGLGRGKRAHLAGSNPWLSPQPLEPRLMLAADVVISEIMHHPIDPANPGVAAIGEEYIELYNMGTTAADLTNWRFDRGVDFTFTGGSLGVGQYLVVAADLAKFQQKYPGVTNVVGGWLGRLSNSSETIELVDALGDTVDEVTYADEGDWAVRRKGVYPIKAVEGITRSGNTANVALVDHGFDNGDTVRISGAEPAAYNGDWVIGGWNAGLFAFAISGQPATPATGNITVQQVLDNGHAGWSWVQPADGEGYSLELINFNVTNNQGQNWTSSTQLHGTPGAANSVADTDIAPIISDIDQFPLVPRSTDSVTITADISDESGAAAGVRLFWRVDAVETEPFEFVTMRDDGAGGDAMAGDGTWTAVLLPQADKTIVEFYVQATDAANNTRTWPAPSDAQGGHEANALYQVDDAADLSGDQPLVRIIMTERERAELADIGNGGPFADHNSNAQMNATFIYVDSVEQEVRYTSGVRNRGHGSRVANPNNQRVNVPSDRDFHGATHINFNSQYVHSQIIGSAIQRMLGNAAANATPVQLRINGMDRAASGGGMWGSYNMLEEKDSDFAEKHFPDDANGNLYSLFRADFNTSVEAEFREEGPDPDAYRDTYFKQTNSELDDWSDLIQLVSVLNNAPEASYLQAVSQVVNVDQWLHYLALDSLMNNNETGLNRGIGDDFAIYRGINDPRFVLVPHDLDTLLGQGNAAPAIDRSIFSFVDGSGGGTGVDGLKRFLVHPDILPLYYQAFLDVIRDVYNPQVMNPLIDNTLTWVPQGTRDAMKQYVVDRTAEVLEQIPRDFTITTNLTVTNGYPRTTVPGITLNGTADVADTRSVLVNGFPAQLNPRMGAWTINAATSGGTQTLIPRGASWRFLDDGSNQGTAWRELAFVETAAWKTGDAELGYGDTRTTTVNCGPSAPACDNNNFWTTYFRHTFTVTPEDRAMFSGLALHIQRDDGVSVYLNGKEVARSNMPGVLGDNTITYTTPADANVSSGGETTFFEYIVSPADLRDGTNVLAVEIHQQDQDSSDISFNLDLTATIAATDGAYLNPGINRVVLQALDGPNGTGNEVDRGFIDIWYDGPGIAGKSNLVLPAEVARLEMFAPDGYRPGTPVLVQVSAIGPDGKVQRDLWDATASISTTTPGVNLSVSEITLHNGLGSVLLTLSGPGVGAGPINMTATVGDEQVSHTLTSLAGQAITNVSGALAGNTTWSGIIHVTGDVIVPSGATLTIQPGTLVLLDGATLIPTGADIQVNGRIQSLGTAQRPVVLSPSTPGMFDRATSLPLR